MKDHQVKIVHPTDKRVVKPKDMPYCSFGVIKKWGGFEDDNYIGDIVCKNFRGYISRLATLGGWDAECQRRSLDDGNFLIEILEPGTKIEITLS